MDLKLTTEDDLDLSTNDLQLIEDEDDAVVQHILIRMRFFRGEWFLDTRIGMPYFSDILVNNQNLDAIRGFYRDTVLATPGIAEITEGIELDFDTPTRKLSVAFAARRTGSDTILRFDEEFILL